MVPNATFKIHKKEMTMTIMMTVMKAPDGRAMLNHHDDENDDDDDE